jgi:Synergist-CTERM protein sorting domain-containing protein
MEGSTLVFTFMPPTTGTYRLNFTLIDADGKLSEPSLELQVGGSSGPTPIIPDPVVPSPTPTPTPTPSPGSRQSGGGSGCDSGMGALTLLVVGAFLYRRKWR